MSDLVQEFRHALRRLRRAPGFALVAVLTLALGIGANTAIFSVVNAVLLRPLPYQEPERLVSLDLDALNYAGSYVQLRERAKTVYVAAYRNRELGLTGHGEPLQLQSTAATPDLFPLLGVDAVIGRTFLPSESQPGHDAVVMLSYGLWKSRFGGDPAIVGQQIRLDSTSRTVVGVAPAALRFPSATTQLWVPLALDPVNRVELWSTGASIIGRLRPGSTLAQANAEVATLAPQMLELFPWKMPASYGSKAAAIPLRERLVQNIRPILLILLGATGMVLLIACVNVANLMLARTTTRQRELAIRTALGAGKKQLVRQLLTESMVLALLGGALGLLLALWGVQALTAGLPADTPGLGEIGIDRAVLGITFLLSLVTGLAFGLLPALRAARPDVRGVLNEGGRASSAGRERRRLSGGLVVAEVALAMVLVTGAGLLIRSFWRLLQTDTGFRAEQLVSAGIEPPTFRYQSDLSQREFYESLLDRLGSLPGVRMAAVTSRLPFGGKNYGSVFSIEGQPDPAHTGNWPFADVGAVISTEYLRTMDVPLIRGRGLTDADRVGAPDVVLINESLARHYWPNEDPVGKRMRQPGDSAWATIIGVVGDVKHDQLSEEEKGAFYRPLGQRPMDDASVIIRTTVDPDSLADLLRSAVASVDPDTPVSGIRSMNQLISSSLSQPRFAMALLVAFGGLALLLGVVGIYGVIAYTVSQRTHEIGVRMALGARPQDVLRIVIHHGMALTVLGIIAGIVASLALTRLLSNLLYGVGALDPLTFIAAPLILFGVALLASYIPAHRAARVDPVIALREE